MATMVIPSCDQAVIRSRSAAAPCARNSEPWVLAATVIGSSMVFIDGTIVNIALPALQREFNASVAQVQWVVEAYALFLAAFILVGGSLGDHFGRRRIFTIGVVLFAAASAACGLAPTVGVLIAARAAQGIAGALLTPGSLAIISASFPEERRGQAIGTWAGATALTTALGPVLGGWLIENLTWRWAFFINLPLAVVVVAIALRHVPESRDETAPSRLDWWGALLATVGLGGLVYGLIEAPNLGPGNPMVLAALVVGVIALVLFVVVEARTPTPMMPLYLFRSRTFSGANLLTLFLYAGLASVFFFLPLNLIQVQGYSAMAAGAALLPFVVLMFTLSRWTGGLVSRFGAKPPLVVGPLVTAGSMLLYARTGMGGSYWTTFFPAIVIQGIGMAITVPALTTVVMGSVDQRHVGVASGINNAVSRTAGLLAIAIMGIVVLAAFNRSLDAQLASLDLPPEARQAIDAERTKLAGAEVPSSLPPEIRDQLTHAIDEAFLAGFRLATAGAGLLALASALIAVVTIDSTPRAASDAQREASGPEPSATPSLG